MAKKDKGFVLKTAKDQGVKFIRLWFSDILGSLKSFAITHEELESALEEGRGFDGSSIQGFARIDESDMMAMPDPDTFCMLPWRGEEHRVARMFCDILEPSGEPYVGDPRWVLKKVLNRAAEMGYVFYVGPELEYFYFKSAEPPPIGLDKGGYFDLTPLDVATDLRRETIIILEKMGIGVEYSHHEVAPSQHEIDLRYTDALTMADTVMTYRLVVKQVALDHGVHATFMPKPVFGENGSGMHTHMSLFRGDQNAFFDSGDPYYLSDVAKKFIAGLLQHAREITLITNQWVNSYKRLVPGYEAPVYLSWALRNRSDLIRVPQYTPSKPSARRVEYRSPDPACNPYLAFAVMLAAGLAGIENDYPCPAPVERNVYKMTEPERMELGIETLPENLWEAIKLAERSELVRETLGEHLFANLIDDRTVEWKRYASQVTNWELDQYLPVL